MVSIDGLDKADVLAALYNAAQPQGMGFMSFNPAPMTHAEALSLLSGGPTFDYVKGRVMKVSLRNDVEFEEYLYDRDNGQGEAQRVIDDLRKEKAQAA